MLTIKAIAERAYRKIGVVAQDEPMTADQCLVAADTFNEMFQGWPSQGVYVSGGERDLNDAFPLGPAYAEPAVYLLAARLAENHGLSTLFDPDPHLRRMQAGFPYRPKAKIDPMLTRKGAF